MIFPDYHLHSSFSSDSDADIHDIISQATKNGLNSICITDHYDMEFPIMPDAPDMTFDLNTDEYFNFMSQIKEKYAPGFDLRIGIELGVMPTTTQLLHEFVLSHPKLDFIIASTHVVDGLDPYYPQFFSDKTDSQGYYRYFEEILNSVRSFQDFNVYGHLDYIVRYGRRQAESFNINDYYDLFREIFKIIVSSGKGIEINTGSLYKGMSYPHPHREILKMYKEAGGEIITIGSDAHKPMYVGYGFDVARDLLLSEGFKYYCTFKEQQPTFVKIN